MKKSLFLFIFFCGFITISFSQDTFSICAIDTLTGEVGSAGASCIDESAIPGGCVILSDVHPGVGVIHTQAYWNSSNQSYAHQLMDMGLSPQQIIDSLVANDAQNNPSIRQYGIVKFSDGFPLTAAYTGINCDDYKNHIIGSHYTIQGNILIDQFILDSMEARFLNAEGELVCRLMEALQGAKVIGADTRCAPLGVSSLSSFLRVARPDDPEDDLYADFVVPSTPNGIDPIDVLQEMVDEWGGCLPSSINKQLKNNECMIFPNPASENVFIKVGEGYPSTIQHITLYNSSGMPVFTKYNDLHSRELNISVTDIPAGSYFFIVKTTTDSFYHKLIIAR